jgi:hypothetical protein
VVTEWQLKRLVILVRGPFKLLLGSSCGRFIAILQVLKRVRRSLATRIKPGLTLAKSAVVTDTAKIAISEVG